MINTLRRMDAGTAPRPLSLTGGAVIAVLLGVLAVLWYKALLTFGSSGLFAPVLYGRTFNSMLLHLLHGRFDVDAPAIGDEGFVRGGATYAYFGIVPALLRAPFLPLKHFPETDFTRLGCLAAVSLMAVFKVLSALRVWRAAAVSRGSALLVLFLMAILFSGAQTGFLKPSIYQEVDFWADALAAAFVYLVLCGYFSERGFTPGRVIALALLAALCLHTRVSTGLGLCVAFGLLWLQLAWRASRDAGTEHACSAGALALSASALILLGSAAAAGLINYERWGSPFSFQGGPQHYLMDLKLYPDRAAREQRYGQFNLIRLGYGLMYYFVPLWMFRGADGHLLGSAFQHRTMHAAELPPGSFFVSDPLLIGLTAYALLHLIRRRDMPQPGTVTAVLAGLLVPVVLMVIAIYMAYRYRIEFYPFLEFCAFIGLARMLARAPIRGRIPFTVATVWSIAVAPVLWFLYVMSPFGPADKYLGHMDVISYYLTVLRL